MNRITYKLQLICVLLLTCSSNHGNRGVSQDIKDSKTKEVFIAEFIPSLNPIEINDTLHITVKEAWIERMWVYSKNVNEVVTLNDKYQLCINTNENELNGIDFEWTIGIDSEHNLRKSSKNSLIGDLTSLPIDTIKYQVQKGDNLSDYGEKNIIGNFLLLKKNH